MVNGKFGTKRITALALLSALSLITFLIENLFPPFFIPGARMGIANVFSLIALLAFSTTDALIVVVCRCILGAIFQGNVSAVLYSLTGGITSILLCAVLVRLLYPKISVLAMSVCSAVCHNAVQNLVYCAITKTALTLSYTPYLMAIAIPSGLVVGGVVIIILKTLPVSLFENSANGQ